MRHVLKSCGILDEQIEPATREDPAKLCGNGIGRICVHEVNADASNSADFPGSIRSTVGIACMNDDVPAVLDECLRNGAPNSASRSGDEGGSHRLVHASLLPTHTCGYAHNTH
jgi:hypothetical protein